MEEIWKDIKDYEGLYQVSSFGRVRSLDREVVYRNDRIYNCKGRVLKPSLDDSGYLRVNLCENGKRITKRIHQLVAIAFLKHIPCGLKLVVNHIDNNPLNNNVENLEITTNRKNTSVHRKNLSGYTGVYIQQSGKYMCLFGVVIDSICKSVSVGNYDTPEIAYQHYLLAVEHSDKLKSFSKEDKKEFRNFIKTLYKKKEMGLI